jgi:hypothetical protein
LSLHVISGTVLILAKKPCHRMYTNIKGMKQNCHHKIKQQFYAVRERGKQTAEVLSMQDGKTKINLKL